MTELSDSSDPSRRLQIDLEDDVRSFLLQRLPWSKITPEQRQDFRDMGIDTKQLRRPSFISVSGISEEAPIRSQMTRCNIGAEGVMTHCDEQVVHLAFKCGDPKHPYHYSTFGVDTIIALAKACEATWPHSVSKALVEQYIERQSQFVDEEEAEASDLNDGWSDGADISDESLGLDDDEEDDMFFD